MSDKITKLAELVQKQITAATQSLATLEDRGLDKLIKRDKKVDTLEAEIIEQAVQVIALRAPRAEDLRHVLVMQKVATILERMGDYARNTANRTKVVLVDGANLVPVSKVENMSNLLLTMLENALEAYHTGNRDLAVEVRNADVEIDKIHTALHKEIIQAMSTNPDGLVSGVHLLFITKNFERIGDYIAGIAEQVYFLTEGEFIDNFRPKADKTSWNA
ncbi:MAG: phosphate signaling complex protein PhoU [Alphaproteobacteria bacterium]|nr:phosphate signaling complex protein PhoU [Alphaproteobacteria bacterium]